MYEDGIDVKDFSDKVLNKVIYGSSISSSNDTVQFTMNKKLDSEPRGDE